ncbi:MAG: hypothetical protein GPJ54_18880 [Candidatus Heimdallarchaeota archaeon]|nr:hypothetical protein [Candidatus Heimdallarchaeota archaeon]
MQELKAASVLIFLSNAVLLLILPLIILRDQRIFDLEWLKILLEDVEVDFLYVVLRLDLIGFMFLGLGFFQLWRVEIAEIRYLIAALALWVWIPVRYAFQTNLLTVAEGEGLNVDILIVPWFLISTLLLSLSGISRIHRWYTAFIILNLISVGLMLFAPLAGYMIKGAIVPFFAINAALSIYEYDPNQEKNEFNYWMFFRKTRI